jgi:hypothetical protein
VTIGASSAPPPGGATPELTARRSTAARSALVTLADWWRRTRGQLIQSFEVQRHFADADPYFGGATGGLGWWHAEARTGFAVARPGSMSLARSSDGALCGLT